MGETIELLRTPEREKTVGFAAEPSEESVEHSHIDASDVEPLSRSRVRDVESVWRIFRQLDFAYKMAVAAAIFSLEHDKDIQKAFKIADAILRESGYDPVFSK